MARFSACSEPTTATGTLLSICTAANLYIIIMAKRKQAAEKDDSGSESDNVRISCHVHY